VQVAFDQMAATVPIVNIELKAKMKFLRLALSTLHVLTAAASSAFKS